MSVVCPVQVNTANYHRTLMCIFSSKLMFAKQLTGDGCGVINDSVIITGYVQWWWALPSLALITLHRREEMNPRMSSQRFAGMFFTEIVRIQEEKFSFCLLAGIGRKLLIIYRDMECEQSRVQAWRSFRKLNKARKFWNSSAFTNTCRF